MRKFTIRDLTLAALIAAVYAVLTVALPIPQYSGVQRRVAEAMTVLPFLFPAVSSPTCSLPTPWTSCAVPPPPSSPA